MGGNVVGVGTAGVGGVGGGSVVVAGASVVVGETVVVRAGETVVVLCCVHHALQLPDIWSMWQQGPSLAAFTEHVCPAAMQELGGALVVVGAIVVVSAGAIVVVGESVVVGAGEAWQVREWQSQVPAQLV